MYSQEIKNYVIKLAKSGLKPNKIITEIKQRFNVKIHRNTILTWRKKQGLYVKKQSDFSNIFGLFIIDGEPLLCPKCKSGNISKKKEEHGRLKIIKKFYCQKCKYWFRYDEDIGFIQYPKRIVTEALKLSKNHSSRKIRDIIRKKYGYRLNENTILKWQKKFNEVYFTNQKERLRIIENNIKKHKGKIVDRNFLLKLGNYKDYSKIERTNLFKLGYIKKIKRGRYKICGKLNQEKKQKSKERIVKYSKI